MEDELEDIRHLVRGELRATLARHQEEQKVRREARAARNQGIFHFVLAVAAVVLIMVAA